MCMHTWKTYRILSFGNKIKNQPSFFHKKEIGVKRKKNMVSFHGPEKLFPFATIKHTAIFIISCGSSSFDDRDRWAGKGCLQTAAVLSTIAFLKMCHCWIIWNFSHEEKYYQWNNQQVKWLQPQAQPVFVNFCPGSILPAGRQESYNINVKCKKCLRHCCPCSCACNCAFWGQLPILWVWLRSTAC